MAPGKFLAFRHEALKLPVSLSALGRRRNVPPRKGKTVDAKKGEERIELGRVAKSRPVVLQWAGTLVGRSSSLSTMFENPRISKTSTNKNDVRITRESKGWGRKENAV